jgi:hypothetical protein
MRVLERARRADAQLAIPEGAVERHREVDVNAPPILHRDGVHDARGVGVPSVGSEHGPPDHDGLGTARERGQPLHGAFPREAAVCEGHRSAVHGEPEPRERRRVPFREPRPTSKLHGGPGSFVQHPQRM